MATSTAPSNRPGLLRRPRPLGILAAALLIAATSVILGPGGLGGTRSSAAGGAGQPASTAGSSDSTGSGGFAVTGPAGVAIPGAGIAYGKVGSIDVLDHNIGLWTKTLDANPRDFLSATNLAILYHTRARYTADLGDYQRALEAARTAIRIAPTDDEPRALEAAILYSLHDFRGAFKAADALYRENPAELGALATRADAEIELGNLAGARADLAALQAAAPGPAADVRLARLAEVTGDLAGAVKLATTARDAVADAGADPAFYDYALGEYQRNAGNAAAAEAGYRAALAIRPTDLGSLLGLARIQAFDGRLDDAISTLRTATDIAPTPESEALLGDVLIARGTPGDAAAATAAFGTVRLTQTLSALAGTVYDRILLKFDLDHGDATAADVAEARAGLADRTDFGAHDLLAWALHRVGNETEAWSEIQAAMATGAADARTQFHAGAIAAARGDTAMARRYLAGALTLGPALDPIERAEAARILAGLQASPAAGD